MAAVVRGGKRLLEGTSPGPDAKRPCTRGDADADTETETESEADATRGRGPVTDTETETDSKSEADEQMTITTDGKAPAAALADAATESDEDGDASMASASSAGGLDGDAHMADAGATTKVDFNEVEYVWAVRRPPRVDEYGYIHDYDPEFGDYAYDSGESGESEEPMESGESGSENGYFTPGPFGHTYHAPRPRKQLKATIEALANYVAQQDAERARVRPLDADAQVDALRARTAVDVLRSGRVHMKHVPAVRPAGDAAAAAAVNGRFGFSAVAVAGMKVEGYESDGEKATSPKGKGKASPKKGAPCGMHEFARLCMRRTDAGDKYWKEVQDCVKQHNKAVPVSRSLWGSGGLDFEVGRVVERYHQNGLFLADYVASAMRHNHVGVVPVEVSPGLWAARQALPTLVDEPAWSFRSFSPSVFNPVEMYSKAVSRSNTRDNAPKDIGLSMQKRRWSQVMGTYHTMENGKPLPAEERWFEFSYWLRDPCRTIAQMLCPVVALPFHSASWGMSTGAPHTHALPKWNADTSPMAIPDNKDDPEAPLPLHWTTDKDKQLRAEQLKALGWMQRREVADTTFESDFKVKVVPPFQMDVSLGYCVRGGILADHIGYGKTATMLGLIAAHAPHAFATASADPLAITDAEKETYFDLTNTTLIVAPSHLLDQWEGEIKKFLAGAKLKVLVMKNVTPLSTRTVKALAGYDVVLTSYRLLYSTVYANRVKELAGGSWSFVKLLEQTKAFLAPAGVAKMKTWHELSQCLNKRLRKKITKSEDLGFPVLQQCMWRRVVLDEFHEGEAQDMKQVQAIIALPSRARWGLTGTPNIGDLQKVARTAIMLRVDLGIRSCRYYNSRWSADEGDKCQRFVSHFIRQNAANTAIDSIKTVHTTVPVVLSDAERVLYLQQRNEIGRGTKVELERRERLVQLCSHFNTRGHLKVGSAEEETQNLLKKLRNQFEAAMQKARKGGLCAFEVLRRAAAHSGAPATPEAVFALPDTPQTVTDWFTPKAQQALRAMGASECEELLSCYKLIRNRQLVTFPKRTDADIIAEWQDHALKLEILSAKAKTAKEALKAWITAPAAAMKKAAAEAAEDMLTKVMDTHRQYWFMQSCLKAFAADGDEQECPVCMGTKADGVTSWSVIPCGHIFCSTCMVELGERCAQCRQKFNVNDVFDVETTTHDMQHMMKGVDFVEEEAVEVHGKKPVPKKAKPVEKKQQEKKAGKWSKYGSKIQSICETLREVKKKDPKAKVIVFCQWKSLQDKIADAFEEYKFRFSTIEGTVYQQNRVLGSFQNDEPSEFGDAPEILLLNLEVAASGANCTAASYVFLVHPFNAPDVEKAIAYELQAIGRVRRLGQARKEIHVYRFVTQGTVEAEMTREHEAGIAARR
eukprot:TRINITY_DN3485_c0_g1_i1.p1 TRINITY_DN3485_c0_g1~~TRINITY_DN3485_c0_g1_i1.p1  ORF type:complete len:1378 (+),score=428.83 TRINITY_DN3485_c0_g1_i1:1122-5255(+)